MNLTQPINSIACILKIQFALVDDVDFIQGIAPGVRTIVFKPGRGFIDVPFTLGGAKFKETNKKSVQGWLYPQVVTFELVGSSEDNSNVLGLIEQVPFICVVTYSDGSAKII